MRFLGLGVVLVVGSATLVGCGGGGGSGGGTGPAPVTFLPEGTNVSFRPPTNTQRFSSAGGTSSTGNPLGSPGPANLLAENVAYQFNVSGVTALPSTISSSSSPSDGNVVFTLRPVAGNALNNFDGIVEVSTSNVSFSRTFNFIPNAPVGAQYVRTPIGAAVPGVIGSPPTTQVPRIGLVLVNTGGASQSLLLGDWSNTTTSTLLPTGLNLSYTIFGRWADNVAAPANALVDRSGVFAFGLVPTSPMPTTGSATYRGGFIGVYYVGAPNVGNNGKFEVDGIANVSANFATGTASFSTESTRIYVTGTTSGTGFSSIEPNLNVAGGGLTISGNRLSGAVAGVGGSTVTVPIVGGTTGALSGQAQGQFYGPNANEVGGTFRVQGGSGNKSEVLIGGFGVKQ